MIGSTELVQPGDSKRQLSVATESSTSVSSLNDRSTPPSVAWTRKTSLDSPITSSSPIDTPCTSLNEKAPNRVTFAENLNSVHLLPDSPFEGHVFEEDDLESVVSDRDNPCQVCFASSHKLLQNIDYCAVNHYRSVKQTVA